MSSIRLNIVRQEIAGGRVFHCDVVTAEGKLSINHLMGGGEPGEALTVSDTVIDETVAKQLTEIMCELDAVLEKMHLSTYGFEEIPAKIVLEAPIHIRLPDGQVGVIDAGTEIESWKELVG